MRALFGAIHFISESGTSSSLYDFNKEMFCSFENERFSGYILR